MTMTRQTAWQRWGLAVVGSGTAEEAGERAGLNGWNVRTVPAVADLGVMTIPVPKKFVTVRNNPVTGGIEPIGVVGNKYQTVQNEEAFALLDNIVDEGGAHFESVGQTPTGNRVFMMLKMPEGIQIGGEDAHEMYLMAANSHDGSSSFSVSVVMNRLACTNQLTSALKNARQSWTVRHTQSVQGRIEEARAALRMTFTYAEAWEKEMEALIQREFTEHQWEQMVESLIPESKSEHEGWAKRVEDARQNLNYLYHDAPTQEFGRGTAYAAYNAAVEYADWYAPVRGEDPHGEKRAQRTLMSTATQGFKTRALQLVSA